MSIKSIENCGTSTHKRGGFLAGKAFGNEKQERFKPNCVRGERSLIEIA
jgi:hypothetical protein